MKTLPIYRNRADTGKTVEVDDWVAELLTGTRLVLSDTRVARPPKFVVWIGGSQRHFLLHRVVMVLDQIPTLAGREVVFNDKQALWARIAGAPPIGFVDGNPWNCQRENLEVVVKTPPKQKVEKPALSFPDSAVPKPKLVDYEDLGPGPAVEPPTNGPEVAITTSEPSVKELFNLGKDKGDNHE